MESSGIQSIIIMVVFLVLMWLLLIRPQRKKEKETNDMRNALKVGDEIITIGGFKAKVIRVKEDSLIVSLGADKTKVEIMRWAVGQVVKASPAKETKETEAPAAEPEKKGRKLLKKKETAEETAIEETKAIAEETVSEPIQEEVTEAVEAAEEAAPAEVQE